MRAQRGNMHSRCCTLVEALCLCLSVALSLGFMGLCLGHCHGHCGGCCPGHCRGHCLGLRGSWQACTAHDRDCIHRCNGARALAGLAEGAHGPPRVRTGQVTNCILSAQMLDWLRTEYWTPLKKEYNLISERLPEVHLFLWVPR